MKINFKLKLQQASPLFLLFLLFSTQAFSQSITASVQRSKVGLSERFEVSYKANGDVDFNGLSFNDFVKLGGPNHSSQMSIINGSVSQTKGVSYVLRPKKIGTFTLPAITGKAGGKTISSNTVQVTVIKGSPEAERNNINLKTDVFVRAVVSKTNPYVGEQFIVTYKLYFNKRIGNPQISELPKFSGFWSKDLLKGNDSRATKSENYKGQSYETYVLGQHLLIPQKFGKLTIEPMVLDLTIQVPTNRRDFWGQMAYKNIQTTVRSPKRTMEVKSLPSAGKPANFSGAVGQFVLENKLSSDSTNVNETLTFTQTLKGKGNLKLFSLPNAVFPKDIEVYDPKSNDKITVNGGGMRGQKENQYILIPRNKGMYKFSIDGFTFFDPKKKKYVSVGGKTIAINVTGEGGYAAQNNPSSTQTPNEVQQEKVDFIGDDILFIHEETSLTTPQSNFFGTIKYWIYWLLPFVLGLIIVIVSRVLSNKVVDTVAVKNKKAKSEAKKRLKLASEHLKKENYSQFHQVLLESIFGYLKDKFNVESQNLNLEFLVDTLKKNSISEDLIEEFKDIIDVCQMANYGGFNTEDAPGLYAKAERLIENIEDKL
ncbi:MAG: BatD family protein [Flavobacteriales bacterium]